jgi:hypothetical protein
MLKVRDLEEINTITDTAVIFGESGPAKPGLRA